tara:strand:- start:4729 stop:5664 length:936 start_codon:yes stop_codon:yes gene_type:complete
MIVLRDLFKVKLDKPSVATIGTFDGVHLGHKKILKSLISNSNETNLNSVLITFDPHPKKVINPNSKIELINTTEEKIDILKNLGLDYLIIHEFRKSFSNIDAEDFVKILIEKLKIRKLIVGYDHRFGKNRNADINDLKKFGNKYGFEVIEISAFDIDEINISSTKIRNSIYEGKIEICKKYMGFNFKLFGKVVRGMSRGNKIGFPTANIVVIDKDKIIPKNGVYLVSSKIDNKLYYGMMNIGYNPTFGNQEKSIEVNYFDYNSNLYNKTLTIEFIKYMRDEIQFNNVNELIEKLNNDRDYCLKYIKSIINN